MEKLFTCAGHMRMHQNCSWMCKDLKCGKSFSQEQSLKIHNHEIHEGHKDIKCEFCGNSLSEEGMLEKHIHRIHEARKDHKYKYCDNFFSEGG